MRRACRIAYPKRSRPSHSRKPIYARHHVHGCRLGEMARRAARPLSRQLQHSRQKKMGYGAFSVTHWFLVGAARFELATTCTPCRYATRLRYAPTAAILTLAVARGPRAARA